MSPHHAPSESRRRQPGVEHVLAILCAETRNAMQQLGAP
jgi:hypothetical protein